MKVCGKCGEKKSFVEFYKRNSRKDGWSSWCCRCYRDNYEDNKETILMARKRHYEKNREAKKAYQRRYEKENALEVNRKKREYRKKRRQQDEGYVVVERLRTRLYTAFKEYSKYGKIKPSDEFIHYRKVIEYLGECPGNRADYHIDHIKPLCSFDFNDEEQVKKAFAPENHQWLLVEENLKKGKKWKRK